MSAEPADVYLQSPERSLDPARELFAASLPGEPTPREQICEQVRNHILPYPTGNIHPRF